tara:strand:+ start:33 stop:305 length:273 start_codon:yes stop_codon:yes gene_type:complete
VPLTFHKTLTKCKVYFTKIAIFVELMKLINRVKDFRQQKNLTQEDLAKLVGVSRQTIISIERYKYIPGLDLGLKISAALDVKTEKVFYFV